MREAHFQTSLLHVNYGQVTLDAEKRAIEYLREYVSSDPPIYLDIGSIGKLGAGTLVSEEGSCDEMYPHRNLMLLVAASIVATATDSSTVAIGVIDSENAEFADCRTQFLSKASELLMECDPAIDLKVPLMSKTKVEVLIEAVRLGLPYYGSFSCNVRGDRHCWSCRSCIERAAAHNAIVASGHEKW